MNKERIYRFSDFEEKGYSEEDFRVYADMLSYVSPYITNIVKKDSSVEISYDSDYESEVFPKIDYLKSILKSDELRKNKKVTIKVLEDFRSNEVINHDNIFEKMIEEKIVIESCDGVYAYSGIFLKVFKYFCNKINEFGYKNYENIIEVEAPVLYPVEEYERGGYFESFPHYISFQATLCNDISIIEEYSKKGSSSGNLLNYIQQPENVLRHAACVPVYPFLKDKEIDAEKPICVMVSGKCFRNEGKNCFELARLKEFFMKEYVFIGTSAQALEGIQKATELWKYWIDTFSFNGTIETANDSFFANNYKKLKIFQILGDSKKEFRLWLPGSNSFSAVSSANIHRTHFTKTYNIKSNNENAFCQSSCFAFGVERLAYALLSQKGLEPAKWDEKTRNEIFKESL